MENTEYYTTVNSDENACDLMETASTEASIQETGQVKDTQNKQNILVYLDVGKWLIIDVVFVNDTCESWIAGLEEDFIDDGTIGCDVWDG